MLSEVGKFVYFRYGLEEVFFSIMGVMVVLVFFLEVDKNVIRFIYVGKLFGEGDWEGFFG